jgi:hypothetical protein
MILSLNGEFKLAYAAFEKVFVVGAWSGRQGRSGLIANPTTGALEVSDDLRLKARKAIMAEVRRMKVRLYLNCARLYLRKFLLSCKSARLNVVCYLDRYLLDVIRRSHGRAP